MLPGRGGVLESPSASRLDAARGSVPAGSAPAGRELGVSSIPMRARTLSAAIVPTLLACVGQAQTVQPKTPVARPALAPRNPALEFLEPYGLQNFSAHYVDALQTFLWAEERYAEGKYTLAKTLLDALWSSYPTGTNPWGALPKQPFGINVGSPPVYYGLRMLSYMTDWRLASGVVGDSAPRSVRLTVLLVGETTGIEPTTLQELQQGQGVPAVHALHPKVSANGHFVVHQSLELFRDWVFAATQGNLEVETMVLPLPRVSLPVQANIQPSGVKFAGLTDPTEVFDHVSVADREATDWWWLIYPSHVPEQYPDFVKTEFVTGGMGTGPDSASPLFIVDDRWLVRKPPHLGSGPYTQVERRAYLPQWLQHEFFHHLYRTYPEFGLEDTPHQWFDLATWPADFVGQYEADYYHESLEKRLLGATPPLHVALRYAIDDAPFDQIGIGDVLGTYERHPILNAWHVGTIYQLAGNALLWTNQAGVSWTLQADLPSGALLTDTDCPYYGVPNGQQFNVLLEKDAIGDWLPAVDGFVFLGETYEKQP